MKAKRLNFQQVLKLTQNYVHQIGCSDVWKRERSEFLNLLLSPKQLPLVLLIDFLNFISSRFLRKYSAQVRFLIIDGTGFKYDEIYPLKILRGKERKKVKSHVKAVVLSVHLRNGKRFALLDESYASEVKLGRKILDWLRERGFIRKALRGNLLLRDKTYDSKKFIELVLSAGLKPYV